MKIRDGKILYNKNMEIPIILISLMLIDSALFYNSETINIFVSILFIVAIIFTIFIINKPKKVLEFMELKSFWWVIAVFGMYFLYSYIFEVYGNFYPEHLISIFFITILTGVLSVSIPRERLIDAIIYISVISSIIICAYITVNELDNIIAGGARIGESGSGNVNTIAMYLSTFSIPILYSILINKNMKLIIIYGLIAIFILLTGAKIGLVMLLLSSMILEIYKNKMKILKYIKIIIPLIICVIIIFNTKYFYNIIRV